MMFSSPQVTPEHLSRSPQPWAAFDPELQVQSAKLWAHGKGVSACMRMRQVVVSPLAERTGGEGRGDAVCAHNWCFKCLSVLSTASAAFVFRLAEVGSCKALQWPPYPPRSGGSSQEL